MGGSIGVLYVLFYIHIKVELPLSDSHTPAIIPWIAIAEASILQNCIVGGADAEWL